MTMKQACIRAVLVLCVAANGTDAQSGDSAIAQRLDSIRKTRNVPALGAAFIRGDGSVTSAVVGVRKRGTDVRATTEDQWPLASNTKAMTATLLATLVEQGALTWETTLAELFPELRAGFRGKFGAITVTHLLAHYAGLPRNFDGTGIRRTAPTPAGQRLNLVRKTGSQELRSVPGTKMAYSNLGYVIAGAVAERVGGKPWEALMRERVFAPLGMEGCGFGGALTNRDTEDVGGPAGTVRCSLADWGKFVLDQLRGEHGKGALLKPETYKALHEPRFGGNYAFGWYIVPVPWAGGVMFNHTGSTGSMDSAVMWILPARDVAVLTVTNRGGDAAAKASEDAADSLFRMYGLLK